MDAPPLVSVRVPTYNHEKYIEKCIEGILMQKTIFPFEVIIGEDCSTDRTREIVFDYEKRYPNTIRVVWSEKNVGAAQNVFRVAQACRGKYLAVCEGDDYWIDPLKLQKQVDFMEGHPEYSLCFHDALVVAEGKNRCPRYFCPKDLPETITIDDVLERPWFVPTASMLTRRDILQSLPVWRTKFWNGDQLVQLWCAHRGALGYLNEVMCVYRRHAASLSSTMFNDSASICSAMKSLYIEFDQQTEHRYVASITRALKRLDEESKAHRSRQRLGAFYFALHPREGYERARRFMGLVELHRHSISEWSH
jgi:glycosyltransferase involved in cell wall biosynthesis